MTEVKRAISILLPTDFGPCAGRAMQTALLWSRVTRVILHVYHNIQGMRPGWATMTSAEREAYPAVAEAASAAEASFESWQAQFEALDINYTWTIGGGLLIDHVMSLVESHSVDYVFIGSRSSAARKYDRLGSQAEIVTRRVPCPVLIAKDVVPTEVRQVIFASTFDTRAKTSFITFLNMIQPFKPSIHLLNVDRPSFYTEPRALVIPAMKEFRELAEGYDCTLHFYPDSRVDRGILQFNEEIGADLIGVAEHSDRLFRPDKLNKALVRLIHSPGIPVLMIDQSDSETGPES